MSEKIFDTLKHMSNEDISDALNKISSSNEEKFQNRVLLVLSNKNSDKGFVCVGEKISDTQTMIYDSRNSKKGFLVNNSDIFNNDINNFHIKGVFGHTQFRNEILQNSNNSLSISKEADGIANFIKDKLKGKEIERGTSVKNKGLKR